MRKGIRFSRSRSPAAVGCTLAALAVLALLNACGSSGSSSPPAAQGGVFDSSTWDGATFQ